MKSCRSALCTTLLLTFFVSASCSESSTGADSGMSDATDSQTATTVTDSVDTTDGSDTLDTGDSSDAGEMADATDTTDAADAVDATDTVDQGDSTDALDLSDVTDGADQADTSDAIDAASSTDAIDGFDASVPEDPVFVQAASDSVEVQVTELQGTPATAVSFVAPEAALASVGGELQWLSDGQLVWSDPAPVVKDIVDTGLGFALVLGDDGVWTASIHGLELSPLTEYFGDSLPTTVTRADETLWFQSAEGLDRWADGMMQSLSLDGLLFESPQLAWDGESLWLMSSGLLYRVEIAAESVTAYPTLTNLSFDDIIGDVKHGRLWALSAGDIYRRDADGSWEWFRLPTATTRVNTHPDSESVWITTLAATWIFSEEQWNVVFEGLVADFAVEPSGFALLAGPAGVARYAVDAPPPPPPTYTTWADDIATVASERCGLCHGEGQYAHELANREQWIDEFDDILLVVESQAMPLAPYDPLSEQEINLLKAWQADGFLE